MTMCPPGGLQCLAARQTMPCTRCVTRVRHALTQFVYPHLGATAMREARLACAGARAVVDPLLVSVALHDGLAEGDFLVTADAQGRARAKAARQFLARLNALQTLALTWGPAPSMFASVASALSHDAHECLLCVEVLVPTGLDRIGPDLSLALTAFPCAEVGEPAGQGGGGKCAVCTRQMTTFHLEPRRSWSSAPSARPTGTGLTMSWAEPCPLTPWRSAGLAPSRHRCCGSRWTCRPGPASASSRWGSPLAPPAIAACNQRRRIHDRTATPSQALLPLANSLIGLDVYTNKLAVDALPHVAQLTGLAALTLRGNRGYDGMSNVWVPV